MADFFRSASAARRARRSSRGEPSRRASPCDRSRMKGRCTRALTSPSAAPRETLRTVFLCVATVICHVCCVAALLEQFLCFFNLLKVFLLTCPLVFARPLARARRRRFASPWRTPSTPQQFAVVLALTTGAHLVSTALRYRIFRTRGVEIWSVHADQC